MDQGDPLAPLLFACGLAPRLRALQQGLRDLAIERGVDPSRVRVLAYLDDVVVMVPPVMAGEVLPMAQRLLGEIGLLLRSDKTQVWSARAPCPAGLESQWRQEGLTLVGVPLGGPLPGHGLPDESDELRVDLGTSGYAAERCAEVVQRAAALLERLADIPVQASPHLPAVQVAALLLRLCGGGKITHLLRTTPPSSVKEAAAAFDTAMLKAYESLALLDRLSREEQEQCRLPVRLGGRGLRSQALLAPAAWVASWAQCLPEVRLRTGLEVLGNLESCDLPLAAACRDALATLPLPPEATELLSWHRLAQTSWPKLQRTLSKWSDQKNFTNLLASLDAEGRARLRSCGGPLAGAWQLAKPASPSERLEDAEYCVTARTLLGQPVGPDADGGAVCQNRARTGPTAGRPCGEPLCRHAHHAHRCVRGGGLKARSADIERVWADIHRECGHAVQRQVYVPGWDRWRWSCTCGQRGLARTPPQHPCATCGSHLDSVREEAVLDLEVRSHDVPRSYFDVTVRHSVPGDPRRLAAAALYDGAVNQEAEADKRSRYPDGQTPWRVIPLALETNGRHGRAALKHLRRLARQQASALEEADGVHAASALVLRWGCRLSVALQRSNAARLRSALGAGARDIGRSFAAALAG